MKQTAKIVLPAFILISVAGLIILVALYSRTKNTNEVTFTEDKDIGVKIENLNYSNTRDGRTIWKLSASRATSYKSRESMILKGVRLLFYDKAGDTFTMKAKDGTFNESKKLIFASGDVVVFSPDGFTLKTDNIRYDTASGHITSAEPVSISTSAMEVQGVGFMVSIDDGSMYINKHVRAVIKEKRNDG